MRYIITIDVDPKKREEVDDLVAKLSYACYAFEKGVCYDCDECNDTGEVTTVEAVYPGEPHVAPIGARKCSCQEYEEDNTED